MKNKFLLLMFFIPILLCGCEKKQIEEEYAPPKIEQEIIVEENTYIDNNKTPISLYQLNNNKCKNIVYFYLIRSLKKTVNK